MRLYLCSVAIFVPTRLIKLKLPKKRPFPTLVPIYLYQKDKSHSGLSSLRLLKIPAYGAQSRICRSYHFDKIPTLMIRFFNRRIAFLDHQKKFHLSEKKIAINHHGFNPERGRLTKVRPLSICALVQNFIQIFIVFINGPDKGRNLIINRLIRISRLIKLHLG